MKIILHDLEPQTFAELYPGGEADTTVLSDDGTIRPCIGCFGCWVKTPGACVLKDGYSHMGELLSKCRELVIISRCTYGSYSPFIRNVLDRSISYLLPYFATKNGETHHKNRYDNMLTLSVHFYGGGLTEAERETAKELVAANRVNLYAEDGGVYFHDDPQAVKGVV